MRASALCGLAFLGLLAVPPAHAAETPSLKLDLARSQDLTVDASAVPLEQLLNALGEHLNFSVDFSPLASRSSAVSGKFEGDLDELLSEILRGTNYVLRRGPQGVTRLVVIATSNAQPSPAPAAPASAPVAIDVKAPPPAAAAQNRVAQSTPQPPIAPIGNVAGSEPPSVVSKLLSSQAAAMRPPTDPSAPAPSAPAAGTQSLGVMTRVAQANVQALAAALNAVCIGSGCSH